MKASAPHKLAVTRNACKLCAPLGASLVFKGISGAMPLLHGSQGCATYIRRYLISHYKEPIDIACSNFSEQTAIFGGGANLQLALDNIRRQYTPDLIGIATTCLSETIGDDVPMFIKEYKKARKTEVLPAIVHVSTPSYQGTHMDGFHRAVDATVASLVAERTDVCARINLLPGMVSPADLRHLKEILADFAQPVILLPDYSDTLDGPLWTEYQRLPNGGTSVDDLRQMGNAIATLSFGRTFLEDDSRAAALLQSRCGVPAYELGLPIGIRATDQFFETLQTVSGHPIPEKYMAERGRLIDSYVDGHKYVMEAKAVVYGEADLVIGIAGFLKEIGIIPVICATGERNGQLERELSAILPDDESRDIRIMEDADFIDIETAAETLGADFFIGNSKGYAMARRLNLPMIRIGFPVHDRLGASRRLHIGYRGTQQLFDEIANTLIAKRQTESTVGYTYM
ncbi:MAG: nitrogenase iron-molybdenum cofactor biosynthesis protein NifN [Pseudomonadota bacterium]